jgi:hypothetical protein
MPTAPLVASTSDVDGACRRFGFLLYTIIRCQCSMHTMIHLNDRLICNIFIVIRMSFLWEFLFLTVTKVGKSRPVLFSLSFILKTEGETIQHHRQPEWRPESDHRLPTSAKPPLLDTPMSPHPPDADPNCARRSRAPPMGVPTGTIGARPARDCAPTDNIGAPRPGPKMRARWLRFDPPTRSHADHYHHPSSSRGATVAERDAFP